MIRLFLAALCVVCFSVNAEARQRHKATGMHPMCNITMPCVPPYASTPDQVRVTRGRYVARQMGIGAAIEKRKGAAALSVKKISHLRGALKTEFSTSGIVAPLAAKVAEIQSACGSKVISAVRHTYIAGTRRISLHASGQAVDVQGNPGCVYSHLQGYAGGYSTDYGRMGHIHISWGGPEQGLRFAHGGGHRHARRYARHRHHRYAATGR
ncbi:MAG: hypothetical protein JWR80_9992 [Bradyrhizobium sp.]|nr:hypothetical protein [Bradyrhizobium sp.]